MFHITILPQAKLIIYLRILKHIMSMNTKE